MQPIKALKDELIEFGASLIWENFEATQLGHLTFNIPRRCLIEDEDAPCYYPFYMRVGLHLGQVMQVIMSCGHFIKFRKEGRWQKEHYVGMQILDPTNPGKSLYRYYPDPMQQYSIATMGGSAEHWRPDLGLVHQSNPYPWQQAQYQLQQYPTYTGYGTGSATGPLLGQSPYTLSSNTFTSCTVTSPTSTTVGSSTVVIGNSTP